jgi:hypothetical protein
MLVEQAQRVMRQSRKLIEQREAQAMQIERFVEQCGAIANELLRDTGIRATPLWIALCSCVQQGVLCCEGMKPPHEDFVIYQTETDR